MQRLTYYVTRVFLGVVALAALVGVWGTAQAGALLQTTTLSPGTSVTVSCATVLSVKMAADKKSLTVSCAAASSPTPQPSVTKTRTPTAVVATKTATALAPTVTRTRRPTRTATVVPPTPTATPMHQHPTATPNAGDDTFPAVNPLILGSCPAEMHDRYATIGPDGKQYRTWHPITVLLDPNNPNGPKCSFAHEHGDAPHPNMPLPPFGYVAAVHGMWSEIAAHAGFKVFTHYANGNSGFGTPETDYAGLPMDFTVVIHQGTAGAGRLTIRHHSFEFWSRYQNRETHIQVMADTGLAFDKGSGQGGSDALDRFIVSHEATSYETWGFAIDVGGAWNSGSMFAAVTNPMNHAHGNIASCQDGTCDNVTMVSTSEDFCAHTLAPCEDRLPFGQHGNRENLWLGNFRTIHEPDWTWTNANGEEFFCTDAMGMRMVCRSNTIRQQVAMVNVSNAAARLLLRTPNEGGFDPVMWLPLGAPGGN